MQTDLVPKFANTVKGKQAEAILRKCVHCGFCNATCPTYQLLGDERDGPRGRIYLIKQLLEGAPADATMQLHLDRCLTCRNCEITCPSGVEYGHLLEIGRQTLSESRPRSVPVRGFRRVLATLIANPVLFHGLYRLGSWFRFALPPGLKSKIPPSPKPVGLDWPEPVHDRKMIALAGCVQGSLAPNTNLVAARVLDGLGISLVEVPGAGCCGSVDLHTTGEDRARRHARALIDSWWPEVESGAEAFVMTASGCGVSIREYPRLFQDDADYHHKATRISAITLDLSEVIEQELGSAKAPVSRPENSYRRVAFHPPCTLQHAQKITGKVEKILKAAGYELCRVPDRHLCCGSAGTYSLLQPGISASLREKKLDALNSHNPDVICTANVGCQAHLANQAVPVVHWIELLAPG